MMLSVVLVSELLPESVIAHLICRSPSLVVMVTCPPLTEILVPAGYVQVAYDATFALDASKTRYISVASRTPTALDAPGLPFSLVFRAEPGKEDLSLRVASAYEKASRRRVAPPMFP